MSWTIRRAACVAACAVAAATTASAIPLDGELVSTHLCGAVSEMSPGLASLGFEVGAPVEAVVTMTQRFPDVNDETSIATKWYCDQGPGFECGDLRVELHVEDAPGVIEASGEATSIISTTTTWLLAVDAVGVSALPGGGSATGRADVQLLCINCPVHSQELAIIPDELRGLEPPGFAPDVHGLIVLQLSVPGGGGAPTAEMLTIDVETAGAPCALGSLAPPAAAMGDGAYAAACGGDFDETSDFLTDSSDHTQRADPDHSSCETMADPSDAQASVVWNGGPGTLARSLAQSVRSEGRLELSAMLVPAGPSHPEWDYVQGFADTAWQDGLTLSSPGLEGEFVRLEALLRVEAELWGPPRSYGAHARLEVNAASGLPAPSNRGIWGPDWSSHEPWAASANELVPVTLPLVAGEETEVMVRAGLQLIETGAFAVARVSWAGIEGVTHDGVAVSSYSLVSRSGVDWTQDFVPVPEPRAVASWCAGVLALAALRRRAGRLR